MGEKREKIFERYTVEQILSMDTDELNTRIFINEPIVIISDHVQILAIFEEEKEGIFIELSQVYDKGDKLLLSFWILIDTYAKKKDFKYVKWVFYTMNSSNLTTREFLKKKGFQIDYIDGVGEAYYYKYFI